MVDLISVVVGWSYLSGCLSVLSHWVCIGLILVGVDWFFLSGCLLVLSQWVYYIGLILVGVG